MRRSARTAWGLRLVACGAVFAAVAACGPNLGSREAGAPDRAPEAQSCVRGSLTAEGVECPALRARDGGLYTLAGDLKGFEAGDEVCVCGAPAMVSICMQGATIVLSHIGRNCPPTD